MTTLEQFKKEIPELVRTHRKKKRTVSNCSCEPCGSGEDCDLRFGAWQNDDSTGYLDSHSQRIKH